MSTIHT